MEVRSIEALVKALNEAGVQYLIVGGLAVVAHGYERLTVDVDLVIGLQPENIVRGLHALQAIGYQPSIPVTPEEFARKETREMWRAEKQMLVLKLWSDLHRRTPIDVFVYEPFDFAQEFARAKWQEIVGGVQAPIICREALIVMKRESGRGKDLLDIQALAKLDPYR
jgi:predicted nucleotidyltransferase